MTKALDWLEEEDTTPASAHKGAALPPGPPTIDQYDQDGLPAVDYRDWSEADTRVVSGPIGPVKQYPGQRFRSRKEAKDYWLAKAGRIYEDLSIHGRWIFRIKRDA